VFHRYSYGKVESVDFSTPSMKNFTDGVVTKLDGTADILTLPLTMAPLAGFVITMDGGTELTSTKTVIASSLKLLLESNALAFNMLEPDGKFFESTEKLYGLEVFSECKTPFTYNCTELTATLSVASTLTVVRPLIVEPSDGTVIETLGRMVSLAFLTTVTVILKKLEFQLESIDTAFISWVPSLIVSASSAKL